MKNLRSFIAIALLLALPLTPALFSGCQSGAPATYKVTKVTYTTVKAAMGAWNDYVGLYKPSADVERKVLLAYKTYQKASVAVIDTTMASQVDSAATTQAKVDAAVAAASQALSALIDILGQFGINLQPGQ